MKCINKALMLVLTFCIIPGISLANQNPMSLATDNRVKIVSYNPDDVVTVVGNHLVDTEIQFNQNEQILDVDIGDPLAWDTSTNKAIPFVLFVKPKLIDSDTNMTVITNQRIYRFHLVTSSVDTPTSKNVSYAINFDYPEEDKTQLTQAFTNLQQTFSGSTTLSTPVSWNFNYDYVGSKNIAPIQAVDNGTFTIFKFKKNTVVPGIFAVDKSQNESLVNFRVQGDYVFIQGVNRQYTLRNGKDVTTVYNENFPLN
jgi:type IV secretion system protein VirB9